MPNFRGRKAVKLILVASAAQCLLGLAGRAHAQQGAAGAGAQPSISAGAAEMSEVTVTARRRTELLKNVPVSITNLSSKALEASNIQTQEDLQHAVPGLILNTGLSRNSAVYVLRGQSVDESSGSPPGVLSYVNDFQTTAVGPASFYDISSIQILKGPQGTLFGRNTTGGAALITTEKPSLNGFSGYGSIEVGNYNKNVIEFALNLPISSNLALRIAGDQTLQNGYIKNLIGPALDATNRDSFRASLLWKPTDKFENEVVSQYTNSHNSGDAQILTQVNAIGAVGPAPYFIPLSSSVATFFTPFLNTAVGNAGAYASLLSINPNAPACGIFCYLAMQKVWGPYTTENLPGLRELGPLGSASNNWFVMNTTTMHLPANMQLKNIVGYSMSYERDNNDFGAGPFRIATDFAANGLSQWSDELQLSGDAFENKLTYVTGLYYYGEDNKSEARYSVFNLGPVANAITGLPAKGDLIGEQKVSSESAYGNFDYKLDYFLPGLVFTAGARYTWQQIQATEDSGFLSAGFLPGVKETTTEQDPSWQVGLQYHVNSDLMLYVAHRGSWRGGGFNFAGEPIPKLGSEGGNKFVPETVKDVEVGGKYQGIALGVPLSLDVAVYQEWVNDVQRASNIALPTGGFGTITYNVTGGAIYKGVEVQGEIDPVDWLQLGFSYAHNEANYGGANSTTLFGTFIIFDTFAALAADSGRVYAQVHFPLPKDAGTIGLRAEYYTQSGQYDTNSAKATNTAELPGYGLVNFRVSWDHVEGTNLSLSAYVTNALNEKYYIGGLAQGQQLGQNTAVPGQPRFFGMVAKYGF